MTILALLLAFPALMAYAAVSDLLTMTISNKVSLALAISFVAFATWTGLPPLSIALHVGAAALVLAIGFGMFAMGWIGGGDAKLAATTALWLGFGTLLDYLFVASLAGGVLCLALLVVRRYPVPMFALGWHWLSRLRDAKEGVPYGLALGAAALVVYPHCEIWAAAIAR